MKRKPPHAAAAREALEEAGVVGRVGTRPLGSFSYRKRLKDGGSVVCEVKVFPLRVRSQRKSWREEGKREVKWFSPRRAAQLVDDPHLKAMIRGVPPGRGELSKVRANGSGTRSKRTEGRDASARRSRTSAGSTGSRAVVAAIKTARVRSKRS